MLQDHLMFSNKTVSQARSFANKPFTKACVRVRVRMRECVCVFVSPLRGFACLAWWRWCVWGTPVHAFSSPQPVFALLPPPRSEVMMAEL